MQQGLKLQSACQAICTDTMSGVHTELLATPCDPSRCWCDDVVFIFTDGVAKETHPGICPISRSRSHTDADSDVFTPSENRLANVFNRFKIAWAWFVAMAVHELHRSLLFRDLCRVPETPAAQTLFIPFLNRPLCLQELTASKIQPATGFKSSEERSEQHDAAVPWQIATELCAR